MKKEEKFDFEAFAKEAADQLRQKKPLTGKDGVFTPLNKRVIEFNPKIKTFVHSWLPFTTPFKNHGLQGP